MVQTGSRRGYVGFGLDLCGHVLIALCELAHIIRNPSTQMFKSIARIEAQRRWCLTGTPIQNSLLDLFSLIKFLRFEASELDAIVRQHIILPLKKKRPEGIKNLRSIMETISLRRNKQNCNIPQKYVETITVLLSVPERQRYNLIEREALFESETSELPNRGTIHWRAMLKKRQLCSYGIYGSDVDQIMASMQKKCDGCQKDLSLEVSMRGQCGHLFCRECLETHNLDMKASTCQTCPTCGDYLTVNGEGNEGIVEQEITSMTADDDALLKSSDSHKSSKLETIVSRLIELDGRPVTDGRGPHKRCTTFALEKSVRLLIPETV